jgi:hypothetical protein
VVPQIQVAHSGGQEDDRLTPGVTQVQHTPSDVEEVIGLQPVVAHQNVSHGVEEGADLQPVIALVQGVTFGAEEVAGPQPVFAHVQCITSGVDDADDDEYLSAKSDAGEDFVSLLFSQSS